MAQSERDENGRSAHRFRVVSIIEGLPNRPASGHADEMPTSDEPAPPADELREYLLAELRAAKSAAIRTGTDPEAMTADLNERLRRLRLMRAEAEDC
jgi:hypothetical protein